MKKHIFLAGLFMSCLGIGLAVMVLYFIFDGTRTEVIAINDQLHDLDAQIARLHLRQAGEPANPKIAKELAKLHMEKVLLPQPWFLQMELAEKGLPSFILNVIGSAEARRARLRSIVLERAQSTKIDECPAEFQRLFKIYASEEGYGSTSLHAMRDFASNYAGDDNFADVSEDLPEPVKPAEPAALPDTTATSPESATSTETTASATSEVP